MTTLSIRQLVKSYDSTPILRGVDLELERGETIVLAGVNGCGKSTLLHCIAGLVAPDAGRIVVEGQDQLPLSSAQRPIGFVTQVGGYFENLTVEANLQSSLRSQGLSRDECSRRIDWILELLQLAQVKNRLVQTLSGGQAQRVAFGRGLIRKPKVLLLDEPFNHLDREIRIQLQQELHRIQKELELSILMVTHQFENALEQADRIALLSEGKIQQLDVPETIYRQPARREIAYQFGRFPPILETLEIDRVSKTFEFCGKRLSMDSFSRLASIPQLSALRWIGIRPEALQWHHESSKLDSNLQWSAQITAIRFGGDVALIDCLVHGRTWTLPMDLAHRSQWQVGQSILLSADPNHFFFLSE